MKKIKSYYLAVAPLLSLGFIATPAQALSGKFVDQFGAKSVLQQSILVHNYLAPAISFLSIGVGVIVVAMVIVGAIQYSASGGNPQAVSAAKKRIFNAILALLIYAFAFAFLNFLIPGGLIAL